MAAAPPVGPVPPAPPAVAPPLPPAAAPQCCYVDYYADDSHDSADGNYAAIMNAFAVPAAAAPTPQEVTDTVLASAVVDPQAFIGLIADTDHPNGWVTLFHQLQCFEPQLGRPTPFNNEAYAFYGDLVGGQAPPVVQWPGDAFHQAPAAIRVPTGNAIDAALAANPAADLFDLPAAAAADSEVVRVRRMILVPFRYVQLLLPGPLAPRDAWTQVAGAIHAENSQADCRPLLDWLRVALTRQAAGQPSRLARGMLTVPLSSAHQRSLFA